MTRRVPRSKRTDTVCPYTTHFRAEGGTRRREAWRYAQVRDGREGEVRQQRRKNRRQADHACCQRQAGQREGLTSPAGLLDALAAVAFATALNVPAVRTAEQVHPARSEERRVGKERVSTCRSRWSPYH